MVASRGIHRLTIPYQLAHGERNFPGENGQVQIPGSSTLVFAIDLKGVKLPAGRCVHHSWAGSRKTTAKKAP